MEEDISNYSQIVMFRGTPSTSQYVDLSNAIHLYQCIE